MESNFNSFSDIYEVEKIINCKYYHNKKYYLIKWLCYPINQSTWEPKSNLKNLNNMIQEFESEYPYSIDKNMYNIFCKEMVNKNTKRKKVKNLKEASNESNFISKKRKIEYFSDFELNNSYLDKLKKHLYIDNNKNKIKGIKKTNDNIENNKSKIIDIREINDEIFIDLSSSDQAEDNINENSLSALKLETPEQPSNHYKLRLPKLI